MKKPLFLALLALLAWADPTWAQCFTPTNLRAVAYGPDFIEIDWDNTSATNFQVRYVTQGGNLNFAPITNTSSKPYRITGLSTSTTYVFQVREVCTGTNPWPNSATASTSCNVVNPPFTTNFDGAAWSAGAFNASGSINSCWQRTPSSGYLWKPGPQQFPNNFTGASSGRGGSGKYMQIDDLSFGFGQKDSAQLFSPLYDLGTLTSPQLRYYYHMFGNDIEQLRVYISNDYGATYTLLQTITGQQQTSGTAAWKESILNLSAYANDTVRLLFEGFEATVGFQNAVCIDDVIVEEAPTCPKPQNLQVVTVRNSSATLSWTTGGATNWQISYGSPGFSASAGTIVATGSNPGTITGLSASANYEAYVRDSCGPGDVSVWVGPIAFTTACNPLATPYTENFDANGFSTSSSFNGLGTINSCWSRESGIFFWKPGPPLFNPTITGPSADHTSGSGQYMFSESSGFGNKSSTELLSPLIDLNGLTAPELKFYVHMFGTGITNLETYVNNGSGFTLVNTQTGQQQFAKGDPWKEVIVSLNAYINDTIQLKFVANKVPFNTGNDISIDDITIDEAPSCPKPQNLAASNLSANSAQISWLSGGSNDWNISYGSPGTAAGAGTLLNVSSNPNTITGLSPSTTYVAYVRDSCGPGDVSPWVGPVSFTTNCLPVNAPYFEDFEGSSFTPGNFTTVGNLNSCWSRDTSINYQWSIEDGPPGTFNAGPDNDHTPGTGVKYLFSQAVFNFTLGQSTSTTVRSPQVDLGNLTIPELRFWYHMFGFGIDSLSVYINNGNGYQHLTSISGQQQTAGTDAWKEEIVSLASYANDTVQLEFRAYRNSPFSNQAPIAIDDLKIDEQPNCPQPSNISVLSSGANDITLSWTSGGATNWNIEYGPAGFSPGSGTIVNANSNPFNITGLSPSTSYDFYLRDSCGAGDVSVWVGPQTANTSCGAIVAPYTENFDGPQWTDPSAFNDPGKIDNCWSRTDSSGYFWKANQGNSDGFTTGPSADHTTGTGKYVYTIRSGPFGTQTNTRLISPQISLDTLSSPELRFWYHMFGADIDKLEVAVNNGTGWTTINTITGQQQTSGTAAWQERIISLSAYVGDTIRLRFRGFRSTSFGFRGSIAIDDIRVDNTPSCPAPTNVTLNSSTTTSLTIGWTSGGATNWLIGYRASGSTQPLTISPASTNPYTITGLNPSTSYEIYVKDSCGAGDVSWWSQAFFASTACGVSSLPFSEDFDALPWQSGSGFNNTNDQISPCWTRNRANQVDRWGTRNGNTPSFNTGPDSDASGSGNYIFFESNFSSTTNPATIRSPEIAIVNTSDPQLLFSYHMFGFSTGSLQVRVLPKGASGSTVLKTISGQQQGSSSAAWARDSVDLTSYIGDTIQIIFRATTGTPFSGLGDIAVDEVEVRSSGPSCGQPINLQATNTTYNSITFSWNSTNTSGASTNLRWYEASAGPGTATTVNGITSPYAINGLQPTTNYVIELFDSCGGLASNVLIDTLATLSCDSIDASFSFTGRFLNRRFSSNASANADTLLWDFGNGVTSNGLNPNYNYPAAGTYTVTLIAWNNCGNRDSSSQTITVCDTLFANFTWTQTQDSTIFTASTGNNAVGYFWDLDEGFTATGNRASVQYANNTDKSVTLTAYNACGDTVRNTRTVPACDPPRADWTYTILSPINAGLRVQFDGTISQNALNYSWDFGDGTTGSGATPIHIYSTPGLFYDVELTVTNNCGADTRKFKLNQIGIEENPFADVEVYPNPVDGYLRVDWPEELPDPSRILLMDSRGSLIRQWNAQDLSEKLSLESLAPGYYNLQIESPLGPIQYPLIKK